MVSGQKLQMAAVKRHDMVEIEIIRRLQLASPQIANRISALRRDRHGTRIRGLANMPVAGAGRVNRPVQPQRLDTMPCKTVRQRRATDIPGAQKQNTDHVVWRSNVFVIFWLGFTLDLQAEHGTCTP